MSWLLIMLLFTTKHYSHEESQCHATYYSIIKRWDLELYETGTFQLKFVGQDTRNTKKQEIKYLGTWVNKNDTLILTAIAPSFACYFKNAKYIQSGFALHLCPEGNSCVPVSFE
jgi:hypothetical protein